MLKNLLIFIPTYNERENVRKLSEEIEKLSLDADILFMDDNSPDGTGTILEELAKKNLRLRVVHRAEKSGIGSAHLEGIRLAYHLGYEILITMDCDFTHKPQDIPIFIRQAAQQDILIGSRYMARESLKDWNLFRKSLTTVGHWLTKHLLKMPYDATSAFRLYGLDRISSNLFDRVHSRGYAFFFESLYVLSLNNLVIKELPIVPPSRTHGHSKMTWRDAFQSFSLLVATYFKKTTRMTGSHNLMTYARK